MHFAFLPNLISLMRVFLAPLFVWCFMQGGFGYVLALVTFCFAAFTDFCDGWVARRHGVVSKEGIFLDPLADKVFIISAFSVFYWKGILSWWMLLIIVLRDVVITLLRIVLDRFGFTLVTSRLAKQKTAAQFGALFLVLLLLSYGWYQGFCGPAFGAWWAIWAPYVSLLMYGIVFVTVASALSYCTDMVRIFCVLGRSGYMPRGSLVSFLLASLAGVGFFPWGPGTAASALTVGLVYAISPLPLPLHLGFILLIAGIGFLSISYVMPTVGETKGGRGHQDRDPSWIVIDECLGMMISLLGLTHEPLWFLISFLFFRAFDISKRAWVWYAEGLPGAWGIMADDVMAGLWALVCTHGLIFLVHFFF